MMHKLNNNFCLPLVWHISDCSDHDQDSNQRKVHETYEWDGNHWEQVLQLSHLTFLSLSLSFSDSCSLIGERLYGSTRGNSILIFPSLHSHLVEHLNAEIVLQTVSDVKMALDWIRSTLLYIRALKNPTHYGQSSKHKHAKNLYQKKCPASLSLLYAKPVSAVCPDSNFRFLRRLRQMWNRSKIARWATAVFFEITKTCCC